MKVQLVNILTLLSLGANFTWLEIITNRSDPNKVDVSRFRYHGWKSGWKCSVLFYSFWSRKTNCCFVYSKGGYDRKRRVKRNSPFITFITWPSLLNDIYVWFSCGFGTKRKYVSHTRLGEWSQAYRGSPDQVVCQSPSACLTFPTHALFLCFPVIESVSGDCCNFSFSCVCAQISCFPWRVWHCCNAVLGQGQGQAVVLTWHGSLSWEPNFAFFS